MQQEHVDQRQREVEEQNKMLDQLHASVMGTKGVAVRLGDELGEQDHMLNRLHQGVDQTADEAKRQTTGVMGILQDSKNRGFWLLVIVLILIIIFLLAI